MSLIKVKGYDQNIKDRLEGQLRSADSIAVLIDQQHF
jgi:hypothetical protein